MKMEGLIKTRAFPWIMLILVAVFGIYSFVKKNPNDALETYNRQLQGQLTDKEKELQSLNRDLGVARSDLMTQEELAKKLKKENEEYDAKFAEFVKKHNLEIASRDKTIAELKQEVKGGETEVVVSPSDGEFNCTDLTKHCVVQYSWQDFFHRFKLTDPNIFENNNETFSSEQVFKVYGEVYQQKEGSLQTRRLVLRELYKKADGTYGEIPGAKAEIVDSEFEYINPPALPEDGESLFKLRLIGLGSVFLYPNPGNTRIGIGVEFLHFKGFGLNTHTTFDFGEDTSLHLGLSYNPTLFGERLNVAIGASYGTPFMDFLRTHSFSLGLIFYITN